MLNDKKIEEPTAFIHVDCDGISAIAGGTIKSKSKIADPILITALPRILKMLTDFNCKATFFVIACDLEDPEKLQLFKQIVKEGHSIGSHSYSHVDLCTIQY